MIGSNPFEELSRQIRNLENIVLEIKENQISNTKLVDVDIMTVKQASDFTGYAVQTLYGKVSRNEIPYMKRGGKIWFSKNELTSWVKQGRQSTTEEQVNELICAPKRRKEVVTMKK